MAAASWVQRVEKTYQERGIGGRLPKCSRPAVVVVDLIRGFTDPSFPLGSNLDAVVSATSQLLDVARRCSAPVVFSTIVFSPDRLSHTPWVRKIPAVSGLLEGSKWIEVDPRLARRETEPLIVKRAASVFTGTDFSSLLVSFGVDSLIVCGATTSGCVRATVVDACMLGWFTFVPRECVGDRADEPHQANLLDIDAKYGDVVSLSEAASSISRRQALA